LASQHRVAPGIHGASVVEAPEFGPRVLNALRQPLEDGWVTIARSRGSTRYPARIQLVLAANPCPCGAGGDMNCVCAPIARRRYRTRLSGPHMDRIDLRVRLDPVGAAALLSEADEMESSAQVLQRVLAARKTSADRWARLGYAVNTQVPGAVLRRPPFRLPRVATAELARRLDQGLLSARGYDRVLRVAWSIVDIEGLEKRRLRSPRPLRRKSSDSNAQIHDAPPRCD
jgi:magnesium chelatase family protein